MAPRANKRNNRSTVTEKKRRQWNAREKIAILMYHERVIAKIRQHVNIIFKQSNSVTGCLKNHSYLKHNRIKTSK